jgi:hypothetical protein
MIFLSQAAWWLFECLKTLLLNPVKDGSENGFRIEAVNLLVEVSILIMNRRVRKRSTAHIFHAVLRIPGAVEIVHLKAPFFLVFQHVHHLLQVPAVDTVWREIFYDFEGSTVVEDMFLELDIADQVRVWLVPLLRTREREKRKQ